ncbi:DUF6384 family protein [Rhodanobacter sp. FW106-PBR-R2A-1-13]|uniref:DUF6384 family protein n=1 Tax=Rhodanobacter sp. FW106-PBR-R2A-1-13 TaxID=3454845 RepID=UPI0034E451CE
MTRENPTSDSDHCRARTVLERAQAVVALVCAHIENPVDADQPSGAASAASPETVEDMRVAQGVLTHARGLCTPRWLPWWRALHRLLVDRERATRLVLRVGGGLAGAVLVVALLLQLRQSHSFSEWSTVVAPIAVDGADTGQNLNLVATSAASITAFPAGAYAHAQAALRAVGASQATLSLMMVSGSDQVALRHAYAEHPDSTSVAAHDKELLASARERLQHARSELASAEQVRAYAQKWASLATPAAMPADLAAAWATSASQMASALEQGDLTDIARIDRHLAYLVRGGEQETGVAAQVRALDERALSQASSLLAPLNGLIVAGDETGVKTLLARWDALREQIPSSYQLLLLNGPGQHAGAVRQLAGSTGPKHYYLLAKVVDAGGQPTSIPVIDAESGALTRTQMVGLEVTADAFADVQAQLPGLPPHIPVGAKASGDLLPNFSINVLPGRITHW